MAIRFRHDAAAVALPSVNSSGRKYGQQLVLQQNQQKYAAQQAGYERMYDAYKTTAQNVINQQRDWQQRDFILNRDRDQNKFQQEQMEAGRQQQFMDEARKMQNGMIMNDIQNGFYDQNTARELQQTIIAESEVLGTKYADATQRANALQQIRDRRAVLAANRLEKPPAPTEEERISSLPVMDGVKYGRDKDGNPVPVMVQDQETGEWKPYEKPSSSRSSGQKGAKGDPGASQRPVTFEEYWGADEDKFQSVLNAELQAMQDKFDLKPEVGAKAPTREDALNKMRDDYDFRQKALGKPQYGEPTLAPEMDQQASAAPLVPLQQLTPEQQAYDAQNVAQGGTGRRPYSVPQRTAPGQNAWSGVANPPQAQQDPSQQLSPSVAEDPYSDAVQARMTAPDFKSLSGSAKNNTDRAVVEGMKGIYSQQPPEIQSAIAVYLDPNSSEPEFTNALKAMLAAGIDPRKMQPPPKGHWDAMNDTNKSLSGVR